MAKSKTAIYAAIGGNFAIAVTKFIAATISGSSAMLAEGIHSVVDTGNGLLILLGLRLSKRPADEFHPFGYGGEVYFWSLIVAIMIFAGGGGISIYEGILHVMHPTEMGDPTLNYIVIGLAVVFESFAWTVAYRQFAEVRGSRGTFRTIRMTKDPTLVTVLFEDTAALLGLLTAGAGIFLAHRLEAPVLDGVASILIGIILAAVASFLAWECKGLLIGEGAQPRIVDALQRLVEEDDDVAEVTRLLTLHLGPENLLVTIDLRFRRGLSAGEHEAAVQRLDGKIRREHPLVHHLFLEAQAFEEA